MIKTHIKPSQFEGIDKLPTVKEVWEKLVLQHKDTHTGLSMFYTKVGILEKKYTDGEDMHAHLYFLTMENCKLDKKAFNDKFLTQIMLMLLPQDSTWETIVVVLLQSSSNTTPLSTTIVSTKLMQEYRHITGGEHADSVLTACQANSSSSSLKAKKQCNYCKFMGHIEVECCKKKRDLENETTAGKDSGKDHQKNSTTANIAQVATTSEPEHAAANIASIHAEFPSDNNNNDVHVIATEVIALLSHQSHLKTYIDPGCSCHLSPQRELFVDDTFTKLEKPIKVHLGDALVIPAISRGTICYLMETPLGIIPALIPNALCIPELVASLLSVICFTDHSKHNILFNNDDCFICLKPSGKCVASAHKLVGASITSLYVL